MNILPTRSDFYHWGYSSVGRAIASERPGHLAALPHPIAPRGGAASTDEGPREGR